MERDEWLAEFGQRIRSGRETKGWTQRELGKRVGIARETIGNAEAGRCPVSLTVAAHLVTLLGVELPPYDPEPPSPPLPTAEVERLRRLVGAPMDGQQ